MIDGKRVAESGTRTAAWQGQMRSRALSRPSDKLWIASDALSVLAIAVLATHFRLGLSSRDEIADLIHGTLIPGQPAGILLAWLTGFTIVLVVISRRLNLYAPQHLHGYLHEQKLSLHACLSSGLLLAGALYLVRADYIPRSIVVLTASLVTVGLGVRRLVYRIWLHRKLARDVGVRQVLIIGAGTQACAVRDCLERRASLGYRFGGFISMPGEAACPAVRSNEIVGDIDSVFDCARQRFADEIFLAAPDLQPGMTAWLLDGLRSYGIDLRIIPDAYDGLGWEHPVQYLGPLPSIPIRCKNIPEVALFFKRTFDVIFSSVVLVLLSPLLAVLALAIKLDSPGPVFYLSERIGKKGRVFRCIKFRTMVQDAERRLTEVLHMNERDGILFNATNDPRITPMGRLLRKYSLDELPQFFNVLRGEMSVVGPRPALGGEVSRYELDHLRRLEVTPGITGLWQVEARQDSSFTSYISLDVSYIDNWSPLLDLKIILRTVRVVAAGTGS